MDSYFFLKNHVELVQDVIKFYTSRSTNPDLYQDILVTGKKRYSNRNEIDRNRFYSGFFTLEDYLLYKNNKKTFKNGIPILIVQITMRILHDKQIIISGPFYNKRVDYECNNELAKFLHVHDLMLNVIFGFNYMVKKYRKSVLKIVNYGYDTSIDIGTGFLFNYKKKNANQINSIIVTNKHVLEKSKKIEVFDVDNNEIPFIKTFESDITDLAAVIPSIAISDSSFTFNGDLEILSEVVTIGYPSIPTTTDSYQVAHKGEVNSIVGTYWDKHELFLFSAKTSTGNSGGPILDSTGRIIGIVTRELFEKGALIKKGKLPYYAGIPSTEIVKFLNACIAELGNVSLKN